MKLQVVVTAAACLFVSTAKAQTNMQALYDLTTGTPLTTVEMYKGDAWGDTYFFIDNYYHKTPMNGRTYYSMDSYMEFERGLNFWRGTRLRDLSLHVEFDYGQTGLYGSGLASIGGRYAFHNADFSRTLTVALMYDYYVGGQTLLVPTPSANYICHYFDKASADVPLKFTGTWNVSNLFGLRGLTFDGFIDVWGNNLDYYTTSMEPRHARISAHAQPQLWMNMSATGVPNLNLGGEAAIGYNHKGEAGFTCNTRLGLKWTF